MPRVLIVDDNAAVRGILYDLLAETFECVTAGSAEEALQRMEFECYEAIITDIGLPGESGIELLKRVRIQNLDTSVIFISGEESEEQTERLMSLGAFAFIKKPFDLAEVEEVIRRAITERSCVPAEN